MLGCQFPDHPIGALASTQDSYYTFADLYDAIINEYHAFSKTHHHLSNLDPTQLECLDFQEAKAVLRTNIIVDRNLQDQRMGQYMSLPEKEEVEAMARKAIKLLVEPEPTALASGKVKSALLGGTYYPLGILTPV